MATFHQKFDNVKDSLTSLFKNRRRRSFNTVAASTTTAGAPVDEGSVISFPQNVKRVMHITFDAGRRSFDGIPDHWLPYFQGESMSTSSTATIFTSPSAPHPGNDDSGVSMVTSSTAAASAANPATPAAKSIADQKELLSLTYDRESGAFVDLPPHWRERLERNNLLAPEFQKNPDLLVSVFALMDEELKAMSQEGFTLERDMYSSSPATVRDARASLPNTAVECRYVFEIEADRSNNSSDQDLHPDGGFKLSSRNTDLEDVGAFCGPDHSRDGPDHCGGGPAEAWDRPQTVCCGDVRQPSLVRVRAMKVPASAAPMMPDGDV